MRRFASTSASLARVADARDDLLDQREIGLGPVVAAGAGQPHPSAGHGATISAEAGRSSSGISA